MNSVSYYNFSRDISSNQEAILVVNVHNKVTSWNRKFIDLWGKSIDILITLSGQEILVFLANKFLNPSGFLSMLERTYTQDEIELSDVFLLKKGCCLHMCTYPLYLDNLIVGRVWKFLYETAYKA